MKSTTEAFALIVGGSSGMGFETAKLLLQKNIDTCIVGNRSEKLENAKRKGSGDMIHNSPIPRSSREDIYRYAQTSRHESGWINLPVSPWGPTMRR